MKDVKEMARTAQKMSTKIIKMLEPMEDPEAFAVMNYAFTRMIIDRIDDPVFMKAALTTFLTNTSNSIDQIIEMSEMEEGEPIH